MDVAYSSETSVDIYHITLRHASEDSDINGSISFLSLISVSQTFESSGSVNYVTPCSLAVHRLIIITCDNLNWCWVIPVSS
jgi:hypothetical protein